MHKCFLPILFTLVACIAGYAQHALADDVVHTIEGRGFIKNWLIAGTFPSPEVDTNLPDGSGHLGFYKDYLESQGGEENGSLALGSTITYTNENGETVSVVPQQIVAANDGIVDLDALYGQPDNVMAYAFSNVYSDKAQEVTISLGSDDAIKVWLNGALVHSNYVGRGLSFGQDVFNVKLEKGNNPMLVKVVDMIRDWGFAIEVLEKQSAAE
jgi:hypothetical protein